MNFTVSRSQFEDSSSLNDAALDRFRQNQRFLANCLGVMAVGLPTVLIAAAVLNVEPFRDSVSHFYYTRFFGTFFVVALVVFGALMMAYERAELRNSRIATWAGVSAFFIALFPTNGHGCGGCGAFVARPVLANITALEDASGFEIGDAVITRFQLLSFSNYVHYGAALILFVAVIRYTLRIFPSVLDTQRENGGLERNKMIRNGIYFGCSIFMMVALAVIVADAAFGFSWWEANNGMFWAEAVLLYLFGLGWLTKGRFFGKFLLDPTEIQERRSF